MTQLNRRTLLTAAAGTALTGLAACDDNTMKSIQARLNPTQAAGGSGAAANAPTQAAAAEASAVSQTVRMPSEPWT